MPVLGLVIVLDDDDDSTQRRVSGALASAPDLELGEAAAHRLPVVLESSSARMAEERIDSLRCVPGVAGVDVVYADFQDLLTRSPRAAAREDV